MSQAVFSRARTEEQRAVRRSAVLGAARELLDGSRVSDLTLNALARRVGLAKSNVLRYFESREAVLLELLAAEEDGWLSDLDPAVPGPVDPDALARLVTTTLEARPLLLELWAASAAVLEHNVSTEAAARYKAAALAQLDRLGGVLERAMGPLDDRRRVVVSAGVHLLAGAVWTTSRPSTAMLGAYEAHPELTALHWSFSDALPELLGALFRGAVSYPRTGGPGAGPGI